MTLPPDKIGDKGQRYEISCFGYPFADRDNVIGWCDDLDGVKTLMRAGSLAPGASSMSVRDRWNQTSEWSGGVYRQYCGGVLR